MALSQTTQDHDLIRAWAEKRGAQPAEVTRTHNDAEPGILRFCFPRSRGAYNANLRTISWDHFFERFDSGNLQLVYQEQTATGRQSNFNKLIHPRPKVPAPLANGAAQQSIQANPAVTERQSTPLAHQRSR